MTDPDAVARALSRLATGVTRTQERERESQSVGRDPERVVDDAEAAMERVERAAAFLDADGEARLGRAIQRAEAHGASDLASRGRAVLRTLDAFRTAANGDQPARAASEAGTTSTPLAQRSSGEGA